MNQDDFTQDIRDKVRQIAALLSHSTPYERSLVLHEAQAQWDEEQAARMGINRVLEGEAQDDVAALEAAYVGRLMQNLAPPAREHVVALIEGLSNHARLSWLIGDEFDVD